MKDRHDRLVLVAVRPQRPLGDAVGVVGEEHPSAPHRQVVDDLRGRPKRERGNQQPGGQHGDRRDRRPPHPPVDQVAQHQDRERLDRRRRGDERPRHGRATEPDAGKSPEQQCQERQVRLPEQVDVVDQHDDRERRHDQDERMTMPASERPGGQPDRQQHAGDPRYGGRRHHRQDHPGLAQRAEHPQHGRRRGRIHEREQPAALGRG